MDGSQHDVSQRPYLVHATSFYPQPVGQWRPENLVTGEGKGWLTNLQDLSPVIEFHWENQQTFNCIEVENGVLENGPESWNRHFRARQLEIDNGYTCLVDLLDRHEKQRIYLPQFTADKVSVRVVSVWPVPPGKADFYVIGMRSIRFAMEDE